MVGKSMMFLAFFEIVHYDFIIGASAGQVPATNVQAPNAAVMAVSCKALFGFLGLQKTISASATCFLHIYNWVWLLLTLKKY